MVFLPELITSRSNDHPSLDVENFRGLRGARSSADQHK